VWEDEGGEERCADAEYERITDDATSIPKRAETTLRERFSAVVAIAKIETPSVIYVGFSSPDVYRPKASRPLIPKIAPGIMGIKLLVAVRCFGGFERMYDATETMANVTSDMMRGRINRNPSRSGKTKVGIEAKMRDSELARPYAVQIKGNVRRKTRIVDGAPNALICWSAARVENGAWYGIGLRLKM
jgi:hypothetical protein